MPSLVVMLTPAAAPAEEAGRREYAAEAFPPNTKLRELLESRRVVRARKVIPPEVWRSVLERFPQARLHQKTPGTLTPPDAIVDLSLLYEVDVAAPAGTDELLDELAKAPDVVYAHRSGRVSDLTIRNLDERALARHQTAWLPNDPYLSGAWGFYNPSNPAYDVNAHEAWDIQTGNSVVKIGVLDTGMEQGDPDFSSSGKIVAGYDFVHDDGNYYPDLEDQPAHGMGAAGIAAAETNDGVGVPGVCGGNGVASGCGVLAAKILGDEDWLREGMLWLSGTTKATQATTWAVANGASVLSNSWCSSGDGQQYYSLHDAMRNAYILGVVVAAGSGNTEWDSERQDWKCGQDEPSDRVIPSAWFDIVMGVGATDTLGRRVRPNLGYSWESAYGSVWLMAPGVRHASAALGAGVQYFSGTSAATPFVAGAAGLLLSESFDRQLSLTTRDIRQLLALTASLPNGATPGYQLETGHGILNIGAALQALQPPNQLPYHTASPSTAGCHDLQPLDYVTFLADWSVLLGQRCEVRKAVSFGQTFQSVPMVWGRSHANGGITPSDPNSQVGYTGVVDGTISTNSAVLKSYTWKLYHLDGSFYKWYPAEPGSIHFAYATLGEPPPPPSFQVYADVPGYITTKGTYSVTGSANASASGWRWDRKFSTDPNWQVWDYSQNSSFVAYAGDYTLNWRLYASSGSSSDYDYADTQVCTGSKCDPPQVAQQTALPQSTSESVQAIHFGSGLWLAWRDGQGLHVEEGYSAFAGQVPGAFSDWKIGDEAKAEATLGPLTISVVPIQVDSATASYSLRVESGEPSIVEWAIGLIVDPDLGARPEDDELHHDRSSGAVTVADPSGARLVYRLEGAGKPVIRQFSKALTDLPPDPATRLELADAMTAATATAAVEDDVRFLMRTQFQRADQLGPILQLHVTRAAGLAQGEEERDVGAVVSRFAFAQAVLPRTSTSQARGALPIAPSLIPAFSNADEPTTPAAPSIASTVRREGITGVAFAVPANAQTPVRVEIFDARGRRIRTLVNETYSVGHYAINWDGKDDQGNDVARGVYMARMTAKGFSARVPLVVVR